MRQTGHIRARFKSLARSTALYLLAGAIWAVVLSEPAGAPQARPVAASRPMSQYDDHSRAMADRTGELSVAASRSAPPSPAPERPPGKSRPARGALTGWFGERRGDHRHPGIDIDGATGDAVVAAAAGQVTAAGPAPAGYAGYGIVVIIDHGDGHTSIYAHLSVVAVKGGQRVTAGQRVGAIGTSGIVTGSHLHFELRRRGVAVDPEPWLAGR